MHSDLFKTDFSPSTNSWEQLHEKINQQEEQEKKLRRFYQTATFSMLFFLLSFKSYDHFQTTSKLPSPHQDVIVSGQVAREVPTTNQKVHFFLAKN